MRYIGASVSALIDAGIEDVWALVSDPRRHPEIAGTGEVREVTVVGGDMGLGSIFESQQHVRGMRYVTTNLVVRWEPPFSFAWRIGSSFAPGVAQMYGFRLKPEAGGTRVSNMMLYPFAVPTLFPFSLLHADVARREASAMRPTLANVARVLGVSTPSDTAEELSAPSELAVLLPSPKLQGAALVGVGVAALAFGLWLRQRS